MKKIILTITVILLSAVCAKAQFNIGGSASFNISTINPESEEDKEVSNSFSISPSVGYQLSEKWEVGISLAFNNSDSKLPLFLDDGQGNIGNLIVYESKTKEYRISPYVRYLIVKSNKFSLHGFFNVYAGVGKVETDFIFTNGNDYTLWGANICPVLMFDLSNKFTLFANLDLFNLGFSQNKMKNKHTTTEFNFKVDTNDILPAIGVIYKF